MSLERPRSARSAGQEGPDAPTACKKTRDTDVDPVCVVQAPPPQISQRYRARPAQLVHVTFSIGRGRNPQRNFSGSSFCLSSFPSLFSPLLLFCLPLFQYPFFDPLCIFLLYFVLPSSIYSCFVTTCPFWFIHLFFFGLYITTNTNTQTTWLLLSIVQARDRVSFSCAAPCPAHGYPPLPARCFVIPSDGVPPLLGSETAHVVSHEVRMLAVITSQCEDVQSTDTTEEEGLDNKQRGHTAPHLSYLRHQIFAVVLGRQKWTLRSRILFSHKFISDIASP